LKYQKADVGSVLVFPLSNANVQSAAGNIEQQK
jgi:hypothetical protein